MISRSYLQLVIILTNSCVLASEVGYLTTCAPKGDCGFGIWNAKTCACSCVPPYCFDELYQSCLAQGSCPNDFEGCTPYVSCPYYFNPVGRCESSPDIYPGVFTVFWDAESCCRANFPSDVSNCVEAAVETSRPTLTPTTLSPVATLKELLSIPPIPLSIRFSNSTTPFQLEEDQITVLENIIIYLTSNEIESELDGITLESMSVLTSNNEEDEDEESNLQIRPVVSVTEDMIYSIEDLRSSFWNVLNTKKNNIALQVEELVGQDVYLTFPPIQIQNSNDGKESNNILTAVLASTLSFLLVLICIVVVIWRRGKRIDELPTKQVPAEDEKSVGASTIPQHETADGSRSSFRSHEVDDGYDGGNSTCNMSTGFNESDFSFRTTDDSSSKGGNSVLGLLYYDGPNSSESDENDGHRSRRSRRSNQRKKCDSSSAKSHKYRARNKPHKRNRQNPLEKLNEDTEYCQSRKRDPDGFDASTIMSGSHQSLQRVTHIYRGQSLSPSNAPSITADSFVDVYRASEGQSVASGVMAPSIVTMPGVKEGRPGYDSYIKRNSRSTPTRKRGVSVKNDAYSVSSVSVNSTGEHTSDLRNQPDVKF